MTIKKKLIVGLMTAAMVCANVVPMAGAAEDGRANLPSDFTSGKIVSVSADNQIVSVIKDDGSLWLSGVSALDATFSPFTKLTDEVKDVSLSYEGIAVLKTNGDLYVAEWKDASSFSNFKKALSDVRKAKIQGPSLGVAIKNDNTLWGWGFDLSSVTFPINPSTLPSSYISSDNWWGIPEVIKPAKMMDNVQDVTHLRFGSMFLKTDGSVYVSGQGTHGILGDYDSQKIVCPAVKIMDGAKAIFGDFNLCMVVKNDNSLWVWGILPWSEEVVTTPTKIADNVKSADESTGAIMYVTTDGQVWTLGKNQWNTGGLGQATQSVTTSTKTNLSGVDSISCTAHSRIGTAVKNDGSLWVWGRTDLEGDSSTRSFDNLYNVPGENYTLYDFLQIAGPNQTTNSTSTEKPTTKPTAAATATASPSSAKVQINGKQVTFDAYSINDNNYFKLRDIAKVLSGTKKQFEVTWNGATKSIELKPNTAYTAVGGELATGKAVKQTAKLSADTVYMNGNVASLTAYTINGNNYFKLRDLGKLLDFGVDWDGTAKCISIDSSTSYTE